jgi:hypothetical protein
MSAWYVLSALGFYPVTPGTDIYAIGTPLFPRAVIQLENGKRFVIIAKNVSKKNFYIQSAALNGYDYTKSYIRHADVIQGGELIFTMGPQPNKAWGSQGKNIPVSTIEEHLILPVPFVAKGSKSFIGSQTVELKSSAREAKIYFTLDGEEPDFNSQVYDGPIELDATATLKFFAARDGFPPTPVITTVFFAIPEGRRVSLNTQYSPEYSAGGDLGLIDGIRGGQNIRTGGWQGYHGVNLEAVVDLGKRKTIHQVSTGFLQDIDSWIFMPTEVEYSISLDGRDFLKLAVIQNDVSQRFAGVYLKDFTAKLVPAQGRFVKAVAKNIGSCPEWHKGAGEKAWIFADEIVIE